jgi:TolA-binding protein
LLVAGDLALGGLGGSDARAQEPGRDEARSAEDVEGGDAERGDVQREGAGGEEASAEASAEGSAESTADAAASGDAPADGTTTGQAAAGGDPSRAPWANVEDVPLPSFLETKDERIEDERPPPTDAQVAALEEMEAEVDRFAGVASSYRGTVGSLLRREYLRQRRSRDQYYARQIQAEEDALDEARDRAILLFERFIQRYPNDPTYTPDAMFRLGELYFERSSIQFQEAYATAREAGDTASVPLTPDFEPTIDLYRDLVRKFPDYGRLDGVFYLIGYCLNEMGKPEQARMAWLNLVCANEFKFDPDDALPGVDEEGEGGEGEGDGESSEADDFADEHPAMNLDGEEEEEAEGGVFVDPYYECEPVVADARFTSETWFRIGEYHFDDYGDSHSLDKAIAAYNKILEDPEDRNYNLALYKVAWAYYRDNRYPEAIEHFGKLVQWSDDQQKATGRAGSELRPEAIQYLGIAFAYDDWNENLVPDESEGMPSPIDRVQDPELLPQDREWTPEVYFQLGQVLFDEAKYPQAIEVWELALSKWPDHPRAPEIQDLIAEAHQEHKEFEKAIAARAALGDYTQGTEWWEANKDHPIEQREAERLAENALIQSAIYYHQQAQQLRRQCVAQQDLSLCEQAQENYALAAEGYRKYLEQYPNNPQAYELQYNLADALFWSENYERAAEEYAKVRDSNLDDVHLAEAARRVVESLKRIVEEAEKNGEITIREEPPEPSGDPPQVTPIEMPELLQRLAQARETYLARVSEEDDTENVREAYDYNNALLLYKYGY